MENALDLAARQCGKTIQMSDLKMTLVERLRNPQYIGQGVGLPALFDTARTLADLKAAAERIEVLEAWNRALAKRVDELGASVDYITI